MSSILALLLRCELDDLSGMKGVTLITPMDIIGIMMTTTTKKWIWLLILKVRLNQYQHQQLLKQMMPVLSRNPQQISVANQVVLELGLQR